MGRHRGLTWNPLTPEQALPPRLWAGLLFSALLASALSVALTAGTHALGGGVLLVAVDDVWGRYFAGLAVFVPLALALFLPPSPGSPAPSRDKRPRPYFVIRMVTFFVWQVAVFAATALLLLRLDEPLGLDTLELPKGGIYIAQVMSLFWTVAFFTTIFVLDARRHKVPPA